MSFARPSACATSASRANRSRGFAAISMEDWFVRDNPRRVRDADELQQVLENAW